MIIRRSVETRSIRRLLIEISHFDYGFVTFDQFGARRSTSRIFDPMVPNRLRSETSQIWPRPNGLRTIDGCSTFLTPDHSEIGPYESQTSKSPVFKMIPVFEWSDFRSPLYLKSYVCTVGIGQGNLYTREGALSLVQ